MLERQCSQTLWCLAFLLKKKEKKDPHDKAFIPEVQKSNPCKHHEAEALTRVPSRVRLVQQIL